MIPERVTIAAPLERRLKRRLTRAVTRAIARPTNDMQSLRRAIAISSQQLRCQAFDDEHIRAVLTQMIEDVAQSQHMNERSLLTGVPRWHALVGRVDAWLTRGQDEA